MKTKEIWICGECGHNERKWVGNCSVCKNWNTFEKEMKIDDKLIRFGKTESAVPVRISDVREEPFPRLETGFSEFDRLMGGGVVMGSLTLVGGDPGIGKSTLLLQLSEQFTLRNKKVLYVCGEESVHQTSLRAKRLGIDGGDIYLLNETVFSNIKAQVENIQPDILIIDSIQIVYKSEIASLPGSVTQVKEIAMECMHIAKGMGITTFVIGHVTKSGELAGPRVLEHIVDTVLEFEGDQQHGYRMLRSCKNRFGPTDEIAVFQMQEVGLVEVPNPSEIFLAERKGDVTGSAIAPTIEGSRAILVEVQALVAMSAFSNSSRRSTGIDQNRLALLLAVLEKRMGYHFHSMDVFVSIAGELKIVEPAIDLSVLLAIASSFCNQALDPKCVVIGEVGLSGEVRSVPRIEQRLKEAAHMGFSKAIIPTRNLKGLKDMDIQLKGVDLVEDAIRELII